jgi:uncharacterized repeat protein (TIGR01451 family)
MATTRTVSTTADTGAGSLRATVAASAPGDTVVVPAGTYTLTSAEIPITKKLEIDGAGVAKTVVSGADAHRVFNLTGALDTAITGMTISHGRNAVPGGSVHGGAIVLDNASSLTLTRVAMRDNTVDGTGASGAAGGDVYGGAIDAAGPLTIVDSVVANNRAISNGGAGAGGAGGVIHGGAVDAVAKLTLTRTVFNANSSTANGTGAGPGGGVVFGGAVFSQSSAITTVAGSTFTANTVTATAVDGQGGVGYGAGLAQISTPASFSASRFAGNRINVSGGGTAHTGGTAFGAALAHINGNLSLQRTAFSRNSVTALGASGGSGGTVFAAGAYLAADSPDHDDISDSSFDRGLVDVSGGMNGTGGTAYAPGAFMAGNGALTVTRVTFSRGTGRARGNGTGAGGAAIGGGAFVTAPGTFTNVTLSDNALDSSAAGTGNGGTAVGGGIYTGAAVTLLNSTVAFNSVKATGPSSSAVSGNVYQGGATTAKNTIVSNGHAGTIFDNCNSPLTSQGNNIDDRDQCGFHMAGTDQADTDPHLLPLAYHGGPGDTLALRADSLAIDKGTSAGAPGTDERGVPRPQGGGFDVGAYERDPANVSLVVSAKKAAGVGAVIDYKVLVRNAGPSTAFGVALHDALPAKLRLVSISGGCAKAKVIDCALGDLARGRTKTIHIRARAIKTGKIKNRIAAAGKFDDATPGNAKTTKTTRVSHVRVAKVSVKPKRIARGSKAKIKFTLTGPARATLTFRRGGRRVGSLRVKAHTGKNKVRFTGRVGKKRLPAGSYRVFVVARDITKHKSKPRSAKFSLL